MAKLPVISGKELIRVLLRNGFAQVRQAGSHVLLEHSDGRITTIPVHGNKDMPKGTLRGILRDIEITPEQLGAMI